MLKMFWSKRLLQSKFLFILLPALLVIISLYSTALFYQQKQFADTAYNANMDLDLNEMVFSISVINRRTTNDQDAINRIIKYMLYKHHNFSCIKIIYHNQHKTKSVSYYQNDLPENHPCNLSYYLYFSRYIIPQQNNIIEVYVRHHALPSLPEYFVQQEIFLEAFIFFCIIIGSIFSFHIVVNSPLKKITQKIIHFNKSDIHHPIHYTKQDEIGTLIKAYNKRILAEKELYKRIEEQSTFLQKLVTTMPLPMIFFDENHSIQYYNDHFCHFFDTFIPQDKHTYITNFIPKNIIQKLITQSDKTKQTIVLSADFKDSHNINHNVILYLEQIHTDTKQGYILLVEDMTHIQYYEQSLEEMKNEQHEKNQDLERTKKLLIRSERMALLGNMIATISHEINTPLGGSVTLISSIEEISQDVKNKIDKNTITHHEMITHIDDVIYATQLVIRNLKTISNLIQNFQTVSIDQITSRRRMFNLKTTLTQTIETLSHQIKKTSHNLIVSCEDNIMMDSYPGSLSQVISNLFMNSLIHGLKGMSNGTITIEIKLKNTHEITLKFQDNGKGIPPNLTEDIFQPFFTTNLSSGSTGLGLHIVYNIITSILGGSLYIEHPEKGVAFIIDIPIHAPK